MSGKPNEKRLVSPAAMMIFPRESIKWRELAIYTTEVEETQPARPN